MHNNTNDTEMVHKPDPAADITRVLTEWSFFTLCLETRDQEGVRSLVYLREQGRMIDLDTCADADLLAAAAAHLTKERDELNRTLAKAKKKLPGATDTEQLQQTQQSD